MLFEARRLNDSGFFRFCRRIERDWYTSNLQDVRQLDFRIEWKDRRIGWCRNLNA
jgi:hypothetical protein